MILILVASFTACSCSAASLSSVGPTSHAGTTIDGSLAIVVRSTATAHPVIGPFHIDTLAYDYFGWEGATASAASVNQLATYAQDEAGNSKALFDCHSVPNGCKAVFYTRPNHLYDSPATNCTYHPDHEALAAASESWFIHLAGYSDAAHRIYGMKRNSVRTCFIWDMNPNAPGFQAWWANYLRSVADQYDFYFIDNDPMTVGQSAYFPSGGGCQPWPAICTTTQEIPDNAHQVIARASFVSAMNHTDGAPMRFFFQQISWNPTLDASAFAASGGRFFGITCEGCVAASLFTLRPTLYANVLNEMTAVNNAGGAFLLISKGNAPVGSTLQIEQRLVTTAMVWLDYHEGFTIVQPNLENNTNNLAIWPEDLIYPSGPLQTMRNGSRDLRVATGVYRREFTLCYNMGLTLGPCAAVVNANSTALAVNPLWLTQRYRHVVALNGGDVLSGGTTMVTSVKFLPGITQVPPGSALLLAP